MLTCGLGQGTLRAGRSRDRIPVGARFSEPTQADSVAHQHNGYRVSFPLVKQSGRGVDHPPPTSAEVKERLAQFLYCLL